MYVWPFGLTWCSFSPLTAEETLLETGQQKSESVPERHWSQVLQSKHKPIISALFTENYVWSSTLHTWSHLLKRQKIKQLNGSWFSVESLVYNLLKLFIISYSTENLPLFWIQNCKIVKSFGGDTFSCVCLKIVCHTYEPYVNKI